jgi:mRNA interferase RelE/StbE
MKGQPHLWRIEILPVARRELLSLRDPIRERIRAAIHSLADDPIPDDSIPMRGKGVGLHRLRVGNYRVLYRILGTQVRVLVIRIRHRSDVYRGFERM